MYCKRKTVDTWNIYLQCDVGGHQLLVTFKSVCSVTFVNYNRTHWSAYRDKECEYFHLATVYYCWSSYAQTYLFSVLYSIANTCIWNTYLKYIDVFCILYFQYNTLKHCILSLYLKPLSQYKIHYNNIVCESATCISWVKDALLFIISRLGVTGKLAYSIHSVYLCVCRSDLLLIFARPCCGWRFTSLNMLLLFVVIVLVA